MSDSSAVAPPTNAEISDVFGRMAELSEVLGANRFKVIAFQKVARVLRELPGAAAELSAKELEALDGVGKGAAGRIRELVETGRIADHDALAAEVPEGVLQVMQVPGIGPKSAALFWRTAGITDLESLAAKLDDGSLAELKGFGPKKIENIKKSLAFAASAGDRTRIGTAWTRAEAMVEHLQQIDGAENVAFAGSLRRGQETIGDIDILAVAEGEAVGRIFDAFTAHEIVTEVLVRGDTKSSVRTKGGMQMDLRVVAAESFGAALMYFTGSKEHNVRVRERAQQMGCTLNEYGLVRTGDAPKKNIRVTGAVAAANEGDVVASKTESDIYAALDLAWIPPELRADRGELTLAEAGDIPDLIDVVDVQAELHSHTTASDGVWSIEELARTCAARGFHTIAVTDHSRSQVQARGLSIERLEQHILDIRAAAKKLEGVITVLAGSEVDILSDGSLDYPDELLAELDVVVASPHAALSQAPKVATNRLRAAIDHPLVTIIGHPTGRLTMRREGLSPDITELSKAAAARGVALEINANHMRLDLRDIHVRVALDHGAKLAINCDAHSEKHLDHLRCGVMTARRGGATKADVVNCLEAEALQAWLASTRAS
ncbi:MAG: DNA polymerase/3'-5' exonuclease PolX [Phycisphaerales bacterium]